MVHSNEGRRLVRTVFESLEGRRLLAAVTSATADLRGFSQGLNYTFDTSVTDTQVLNALSLLDLARSATVSRTNLAVATTGANQKRVTWPGLAAGGTLTGVLEDGHYEAIVEDGTGSPLSAPSVLPFAFYRGDANGDTDVDFDDLVVLAQNYNLSGKTYSQGDFNYSGTVDFDDLVVLAQKYNTKLAPLPAVSNSLATGSNTSSSITLNFSPPIDPITGVTSTLFTGFRVFRSTDGVNFSQVSSDTDPVLQANGGALYTYTDPSLSAGTKYWYRVRPFNTNGANGAPTGNWHTTNKVWSVTGLPAPVDIQALQSEQDQLTLTWAAGDTVSSPNLVEYRVFRSTTPGYAGTQVGTIAPGQPFEFTATLPALNTVEYYYVQAVRTDTGAQSFFSPIVATPPAAPNDVAVQFVEAQGALEVTWAASATPDTVFNVYRSTVPTFDADPLVNLIASNVDATSYLDTNVVADTRYFYQVTAVGPVEGSIQPLLQDPPQSIASDRVSQVTTSSAAPTHVTVEVVDDNDVQLTWQDNSFLETGFVLEGRLAGTETWASLGQVNGDQTHAFLSGLASETDYEFRVGADFLLGPNRYSDFASTTTKAVGDATQLVLVILGHNQSLNDVTYDGTDQLAGLSQAALRLRNDGFKYPVQNNRPTYRVRRASEYAGDNPDINADGTGAMYDWALSELQSNQGILNVAVIGFSHGAAIARLVANRLDAARTFTDLWRVRYTAFIDAIQRVAFDDFLPVGPERRIPSLSDTSNYRHDSFYSSLAWNPFTNPVHGGASNGGNNFPIALGHLAIDKSSDILNSVIDRTRTQLGT